MSADLRNGVLGALQLVKRAIGHADDVLVRLFHESLFQGGNGRARLLVHFIQHNRRRQPAPLMFALQLRFQGRQRLSGKASLPKARAAAMRTLGEESLSASIIFGLA